MSENYTHVIYDPPIILDEASGLAVLRWEPEGRSFTLSDGRTLYAPTGDYDDPETSRAFAEVDVPALLADPVQTPQPVPERLTKRQLRQWLITHSLFAAVEAAIAGIADATQRALAQNWWDTADVYERGHPMIAQVGDAIGMTEAEIDDAFREAATL
ncbi:hypothetical protein OpiT1DRAFT_05298 [Opitutaceae bacterium TAV1]|nr:hypothetical protein OpiT1DRAFT_05298 [Opitutaceae bacterium TAV1]